MTISPNLYLPAAAVSFQAKNMEAARAQYTHVLIPMLHQYIAFITHIRQILENNINLS